MSKGGSSTSSYDLREPGAEDPISLETVSSILKQQKEQISALQSEMKAMKKSSADKDTAIELLEKKIEGLTTQDSQLDDMKGQIEALTSGGKDILGALMRAQMTDTDKKKTDEDLIGAARIGDETGIKELLKKGANMEANAEECDEEVDGEHSWTPLLGASAAGHLEVVRLLIERGAQVNGKTEEGDFTALMVAAREGHLSIVEYLIEQQADVHIKNAKGATALFFSITEGEFGVTKFLIEKGARFNIKNEDNWTPLMVASHAGHLAEVKLLIKKKAEIDTQLPDGKTAIVIARENNNTKIVSVLEEAQKEAEKEAQKAAAT